MYKHPLLANVIGRKHTVLTLEALVDDPALELTLVVPGPPGAIRQEVLWVHNTELPDPSPYVRATELVLTNGLWRDTVTAEGFVAALQRARASGLVFGLTSSLPNCQRISSRHAPRPPCRWRRFDRVPFTAITEAAARLQGGPSGGPRGPGPPRKRVGDVDLPRRRCRGRPRRVAPRPRPATGVVDRLGRRLAGAKVAMPTSIVRRRRTFPPSTAAGGRPARIGTASLFLVEGAMGDVDAGRVLPAIVARTLAEERDGIEQAAGSSASRSPNNRRCRRSSHGSPASCWR